MSIMSKTQFRARVKSIRGNAGKLADAVQDALVSAAYFAHGPDANVEPFNQILDAIGDVAHVQGVTRWAERNGCAKLEKGRFVLNKTRYKSDRVASVAEFAEKETELRDGPRWDALDANQAVRAKSEFKPDDAIARLVAKLKSKGEAGLADAIAKAAITQRAAERVSSETSDAEKSAATAPSDAPNAPKKQRAPRNKKVAAKTAPTLPVQHVGAQLAEKFGATH